MALLPGSRRSELHHMADAFVLAAQRFHQEVPDVHFVCPTATRETRDMFETRAVRATAQTELPLTLLFGHSHEALAAADLALVASGTATLETALVQDADGDHLPAVAAQLGDDAPHGLPALRRPAQHPRRREAGARAAAGPGNPQALADALLALLRDGAARKRQVERFREFHVLLRQNTAEKAADAVLEVMDGARA